MAQEVVFGGGGGGENVGWELEYSCAASIARCMGRMTGREKGSGGVSRLDSSMRQWIFTFVKSRSALLLMETDDSSAFLWLWPTLSTFGKACTSKKVQQENTHTHTQTNTQGQTGVKEDNKTKTTVKNNLHDDDIYGVGWGGGGVGWRIVSDNGYKNGYSGKKWVLQLSWIEHKIVYRCCDKKRRC